MKMLKLSALCAAVVLLLTSAAYINNLQSRQRKPLNFNTGKGFAVLELFTSEGCSSCPPAEQLLERIQKESDGKPVYILAYHVDYWDRLGWKDVFSSSDFSKRQYWYNRKFTSQVYTPQLIVNGTQEFVGSDESAIRKSLTDALTGQAAKAFTLNAHQEADKINIEYQLSDNFAHTQLLIALVQKQAISNVKAGENEGKTLSHVQIVRGLHKFDLSAKGEGRQMVAIPAALKRQDLEVIGFVQKPETGEILAATRALIK